MPICRHTNCIYSYWPPSLRTKSLKSIHGCGYLLVRVCAFGRSENTRENGHGEKNRQGLSLYFFNRTLLFHLRMPLKHRRCFPHTVFRRQLESLEHLEVSQIPLPWKHFHIKQPIHDKKKKKSTHLASDFQCSGVPWHEHGVTPAHSGCRACLVHHEQQTMALYTQELSQSRLQPSLWVPEGRGCGRCLLRKV